MQLKEVEIDGNKWLLSSNRVLFWEQQNALLLADAHLGKTGHFRKEGIGIPQDVYQKDLHRLFDCIHFFQTKHVWIIGDLFHSHGNKELDLFLKWRKDFKKIEFHLVKGNHDILPKQWYEDANIQLHAKEVVIGNIELTHDPKDYVDPEKYSLSGHVHPGVLIKGLGRQKLRFPCFYFGQKQGLLPAFGEFTGLFTIETESNDKCFAIVNHELIPISC